MTTAIRPLTLIGRTYLQHFKGVTQLREQNVCLVSDVLELHDQAKY